MCMKNRRRFIGAEGELRTRKDGREERRAKRAETM